MVKPGSRPTKVAFPFRSSYCLAEYRGGVYIGTGYEPYHGQVYRWLGDSGSNHWELVAIAPPRSIVRSLAVFNDGLFAIQIYGWQNQGYETSTPVYVIAPSQGGGAWCEPNGCYPIVLSRAIKCLIPAVESLAVKSTIVRP